MNRATPTTDTIPVNTGEQALGQRFKKLFGLHVGLVQALGNTVQLLCAAAADCKIFREASRAKKVSSPDERLVLFVKASNNWFAKVRAKAPAVQHGGNEFKARLGGSWMTSGTEQRNGWREGIAYILTRYLRSDEKV